MYAVNNIVEELTELYGDWTHHTSANWTMVYACDSSHLGSGSGHKKLVAEINFGAIDLAFQHGDTNFGLY